MSSNQTPVRVNVKGDSPYDVLIGRHLLGELPAMLGADVRKVLIIHPASLSATADVVRDDLNAEGYEALQAEVPDAEESKTAQVAAFCWQVLPVPARLCLPRLWLESLRCVSFPSPVLTLWRCMWVSVPAVSVTSLLRPERLRLR